MLTRGAAPPAEAAIVSAFAGEGLAPSRWAAGPGATFAPHAHPRDKVLYCVAGSIEFTIEATDEAMGETLAMRPGDRLDLPAGTRHAAVAGPGGVICIEAMRG